MKEIDFSNKALGIESNLGFPEQVQAGTIERFKALIDALCANYNGVIVVSGAVVSVSGSTHSNTAGVLYYNGKLYSAPSGSVNVAGGQTAVWSVNANYTRNAFYGDGAQRPTFYENEMQLSSGASGSGASDFDNTVSLIDRLKLAIGQQAAINDLKDELVGGAPGALNALNELANALGNDPNFAATVTNLIATAQSTADSAVSNAATAQSAANSANANADTRATKAQPALVACNITPGDIGYNITSNLFVRTNDQGITFFKGTLTIERTISGVAAIFSMGTIPTAHRPNRTIRFFSPTENGGIAAGGISFGIQTDGQIFGYPPVENGETKVFSFDNLSYIKDA